MNVPRPGRVRVPPPEPLSRSLTVDDTHKPVLVPATFAAAIEPGTFVRVDDMGGGEDGATVAMPVEIWSSPERKKLIAYLGLAL